MRQADGYRRADGHDWPPTTGYGHRGATRRARLGLAGLVAADVIGLVVLHRGAARASVDWFSRATWTAAPPEVVVAAVVRLAALSFAYWVAATVVWAILTHRRPSAGRRRHWAMLPGVRRMVERALAVSIAATTALGAAPAWAQQPPPIPVIVETTVEPDAPGPSGTSRPAGLDQVPAPLPETSIPETSIPTGAAARNLRPAARTHTVRPGEHLWLIAVRHLESIGAPASDQDVAPYWARLIAANCDTIRSGDPDLIYPGEVLKLPEVIR